MFKSISWQEYFYATSIVLTGYYSISILLLYSKEIILKFKTSKSRPVEDKKQPSLPLKKNLMGSIRKDRPIENASPYQKIVHADEISVYSQETRSNDQNSPDALLFGTVTHLLFEIKTVSQIISDNKGSKEDGASMFQPLLENYAHLSSTKYQEAINLFLYDQCKNQCAFEIELNEIKSWWPSVSQ